MGGFSALHIVWWNYYIICVSWCLFNWNFNVNTLFNYFLLVYWRFNHTSVRPTMACLQHKAEQRRNALFPDSENVSKVAYFSSPSRAFALLLFWVLFVLTSLECYQWEKWLLVVYLVSHRTLEMILFTISK